MRMLSDAHLLEVWDRGQHRDPVGRALALLSAVRPELGTEALADVSVIERDLAILRLRKVTFGARLHSYADCPSCGERLEFDFDASTLGEPGEGPIAGEIDLPSGLRFRLPTTRDLAAIASEPDAEQAARLLARRCCAGETKSVASSEALLDEIEQQLAALGETADVRLDLTCPACGHGWVALLDIVAYFWEEIEERAQRLLDDVHAIAARYGWSEEAILALSESRRRAYLDRCVS
jgi:hypothetical protein